MGEEMRKEGRERGRNGREREDWRRGQEVKGRREKGKHMNTTKIKVCTFSTYNKKKKLK